MAAMNETAALIASGRAVMGIEFGSTRIKAVLIDEDHNPIASGDHGWENHFENGIWTYPLEEVWDGLRSELLAEKRAAAFRNWIGHLRKEAVIEETLPF